MTDMVTLLGVDLHGRLIAHLRETMSRSVGGSREERELVFSLALELYIGGAQTVLTALQNILSKGSHFIASRPKSEASQLFSDVWDEGLPAHWQEIRDAATSFLKEYFPEDLSKEVVSRLMRTQVN